jgi:hypothetical protein
VIANGYRSARRTAAETAALRSGPAESAVQMRLSSGLIVYIRKPEVAEMKPDSFNS